MLGRRRQHAIARACLVAATISVFFVHRPEGNGQQVEDAPATASPWTLEGKSLYFLFVDRFARDVDDGDTDVCYGERKWCGGTLRGVERKLDYLQGMGFDCVWITPVVEQPEDIICTPGSGDPPWCGSSFHGYWTQNFWAVDHRFGTSADLVSLSRALKARGMCLVLDVVVNHVRPVNVGSDLQYVKPFDKPEHYHMYKPRVAGESFDSYVTHPTICLPPPNCGVGDFNCKNYDQRQIQEGWFYNLADLDQERNDGAVGKELIRWIKYMVQSYGIDGIRLDTASYMRRSFLKEFRDAAGGARRMPAPRRPGLRLQRALLVTGAALARSPPCQHAAHDAHAAHAAHVFLLSRGRAVPHALRTFPRLPSLLAYLSSSSRPPFRQSRSMGR